MDADTHLHTDTTPHGDTDATPRTQTNTREHTRMQKQVINTHTRHPQQTRAPWPFHAFTTVTWHPLLVAFRGVLLLLDRRALRLRLLESSQLLLPRARLRLEVPLPLLPLCLFQGFQNKHLSFAAFPQQVRRKCEPHVLSQHPPEADQSHLNEISSAWQLSGTRSPQQVTGTNPTIHRISDLTSRR